MIREPKKVCSGPCRTLKPLEEFPIKGGLKKDGTLRRYPYCKKCHSTYQRTQSLHLLFRLTPAEYERILAHQGGTCAICQQPPKKRRLAVDHDHKTGLVRGLVCSFCNRAMGLFQDDMDRFKRVIDFMTSPPATVVLGAPRYGLKGRVSNKRSTMKRMNRDLFDRPKRTP